MRKEPKTPKSSGRRRQAESGRRNLLKFRERNARPATAHGVHTVIASNGATMPAVPSAEEIRADVDALISEAIADLGGESELTAQRKVVLESERLALLVLKLAGAYLIREGLLNKHGKPHAVLNVAATYANSARLSALALGLERRAKKIGPQNLEEHLAQIAAKESQDETQIEN